MDKYCNWCGSSHEVIGTQSFIVRCSNRDCLLHHILKFFRTKEEAVKAWNERKIK